MEMNALLANMVKLASTCGADTDLHKAAFNGDVERLKQLLVETDLIDAINQRNRLGCTPLRLAATGGHAECVAQLLSFGSAVDISDVKGQTPLAVAVKQKNINCVPLLLKAGANPDGDAQNICTPLYIAAMEGYMDAVKELVSYGADLNSSALRLGSFTSTPLYVTIAYRHYDCFRYLLLAGADPDIHCQTVTGRRGDSSGSESLYHAAVTHKADFPFIQLLYEVGARLHYRDKRGLFPWQLEMPLEMKDFLQHCADVPMMLKGQCRIAIRRALGRYRLKHIPDLPLPNEIQLYLQHQL